MPANRLQADIQTEYAYIEPCSLFLRGFFIFLIVLPFQLENSNLCEINYYLSIDNYIYNIFKYCSDIFNIFK